MSSTVSASAPAIITNPIKQIEPMQILQVLQSIQPLQTSFDFISNFVDFDKQVHDYFHGQYYHLYKFIKENRDRIMNIRKYKQTYLSEVKYYLFTDPSFDYLTLEKKQYFYKHYKGIFNC
jgi:hypothetical protein